MGAWDITCKDLKLLARDKRALVLLLLLPLLFIAILGMSTGQFLTKDDQPSRYRVAVIDEDGSELSARTIANLKKHGQLLLEDFPTRAAAEESIKKQQSAALLAIGSTYEEKVDELTLRDMFGREQGALADGPDAVDITLETSSSASDGELIRYFLFSEIYRTIFPVVARRNTIMRPYLPREDSEEAAEDGETASVAAETGEAAALAETEKKAATGNPVYRFLVPGFTVMFVFFLINIMARSFIAERDLGTLRRLRLAPISPVAVLVGKTLPFYLASVLQTSLLFLSGRLLFQMSWGPEPIYLIPVILCTSAAATSLGLMLAAWVQTDQQVSAYGTSMVLILGGISGCFIPRAWLPDLMKTLSLATPHAWALQAFDAVLTKDSVDTILVHDYCFVLLGFAAAFFFVGWWRFRQTV
jgi:ABC-2 type transport system permease protein